MNHGGEITVRRVNVELKGRKLSAAAALLTRSAILGLLLAGTEKSISEHTERTRQCVNQRKKELELRSLFYLDHKQTFK